MSHLNLSPLQAHWFFLQETLSLIVVTCFCVFLTFVPFLWYTSGSLKTAFAETLQVCRRVIVRFVVVHYVTLVLVYAFFMLHTGPVGLWQSSVACGDRCPEFYAYFVPFVVQIFNFTYFVAIAWGPVMMLVTK